MSCICYKILYSLITFSFVLSMPYTAWVTQWEHMYVATCLENGVVSQWTNPQQALNNLKEAVYAYNLVENELEQWLPSFSFVSTFSVPQHA